MGHERLMYIFSCPIIMGSKQTKRIPKMNDNIKVFLSIMRLYDYNFKWKHSFLFILNPFLSVIHLLMNNSGNHNEPSLLFDFLQESHMIAQYYFISYTVVLLSFCDPSTWYL